MGSFRLHQQVPLAEDECMPAGTEAAPEVLTKQHLYIGLIINYESERIMLVLLICRIPVDHAKLGLNRCAQHHSTGAGMPTIVRQQCPQPRAAG